MTSYNCSNMAHIVIDARIRRSSTGRYIDRLLEHLQDLDPDNKYTVLIRPEDPWQPRANNFSRVFSHYKQFSFNPIEQFGFARQLRRLKPDLVHFPMNQQPLMYFGKTVTSTMDLTMLRYSRAGKSSLLVFKLKMLGYRFLFWYSLKKSRAIITISQYVREELAEHYPFTTDKTTVTLCASEPPLPAEPIQPPSVKTPYILYVGSAFPHKNLERLIEAFEIARRDQPDLQLILVGKKEYYYEQLEARVQRLPYHDAIIFTGFIPDAQLKWLYEHAEAYVFPSLSEGFGLPGLEAMTHSCPLISSNATCLPEIYGDAAHYFSPEDPYDIAKKIVRVVGDEKLRAKLIIKGHRQVKKYSWAKTAEQTIQVYAEILAKR